jgi:hypothetical protein
MFPPDSSGGCHAHDGICPNSHVATLTSRSTRISFVVLLFCLSVCLFDNFSSYLIYFCPVISINTSLLSIFSQTHFSLLRHIQASRKLMQLKLLFNVFLAYISINYGSVDRFLE